MAPLTQTFDKDEKVLCFHHELLYEAKVLDARHTDSNDKKSPWQYLVHYKGWKNTWDDWVPADRLRKHSEENLELARNLKKEMERVASAASKPKTAVTTTKRKVGTSGRGSEERHSTPQLAGKKRGRDQETEKETDFQNKPMIFLPTPDILKAILVDDWELVTSKNQFVPLPSKTPISMILEDWYQYEMAARASDPSATDILEETVKGLKAYGDVSLGRRLMYKQERPQYWSMIKRLNNPEDELHGKRITDIYGGEHLLRQLTHMPELMVHTALEDSSINRIREEVCRLLMWLARNEQISKYFTVAYANSV